MSNPTSLRRLKTPNQRFHNRFTVLELIVVVAIISILMVMLMPALGKARSVGKRSSCQNNLKQQATAYAMYFGDYDDFFPARVNTFESRYRVGGKQGTAAWASIQDPEKMLNPYVGFNKQATTTTSGQLEVFHCPDDRGIRWAVFGFTDLNTVAWDHTGSSYQYNSDGKKFVAGDGLHGKRVTQVSVPEFVVLTADWSSRVYYDGAVFAYYYWHHRKEIGWGNYLFIDGHADLFRHVNVPSYQYGPDLSFIWDDRP